MRLVNMALALCFVLLATAGIAETAEERVERLERSLTTLEKQVYRNTSANKGRSGKSTNSEDASGAADARIGEIEERMRLLNGKVEEMDYSLRKFAERLDTIIGDVDRRINTLETRYSGGGMVTHYPDPQAPATSPAAASLIPPAFPADAAALPTEAAIAAAPANAGTASAPAPNVAIAAPQIPAADKNAASPAGEKAVYDQAFDLLREGKYEEAAKELQGFLSKYPKSEYADNAYYWLGETFYLQKTYDKAAVQFMRGYQYSPKGNKAADNLLKLGMSLAELKKNKEACTTFRKLIQEFPDSAVTTYQRAQSEMARWKCGA